MAFSKRIGVPLLGASIALCAAQIAVASERGNYESVMGFAADYTEVEHAGKAVTGGSLHGTATTTKSSGAPFVEGTSSVAVCIVYAKESEAGIDLEAPCTLTDSAGDKLFLMVTRTAGDIATGGGGEGRQQLVGGTGKYAGLTGSCTYTVEYLPGNMGVTRSTCEWQKP